MEHTIRTEVEVNDLKAQWEADPCWDLETTEGFEAHHEELRQYRLSREHMWAWLSGQRIQRRAATLGVSVQVMHFIEDLESRIDDLERKVFIADESARARKAPPFPIVTSKK